jgi:NTP pyrophosphatase (non-canonical NTP hydrolase)
MILMSRSTDRCRVNWRRRVRKGAFVDEVSAAVRAAVAWLDAANGRDEANLTFRILKIVEEAGEAATAWIGAAGNNPRKGVTHSVDDVACELADVALSALVAIESLGRDHREVLNECAARVTKRLQTVQ